VAAFLAWAICCVAQNPLQITSPASGTVVSPGQTITFVVTADSSVSNIAILGQNPLGFSQTTTAPLQFVLPIPADTTFDRYQVRAVGVAGGQDIESEPITLFVDSPDFLANIRTQPSSLHFRAAGEVMPLRVIATAPDGTQHNVTYSKQTTYRSSDQTVATVDARGLVNAVGPGAAVIFVDLGLVSVPVNVPANANADTVPPVTTASVSPLPNAAGWNNSTVTIQFLSTDNESGGSGVKQITYSAVGAQTVASTNVPGASASLIINAEGITTVTFFGTDNAGNTETAKTLTIQLDKTPPNVACTASPDTLWPPNHKLVTINVSVTISDSLSGSAGFSLASVTSNEPDSGVGDIQGFVIGTASTNGQLRAERLGSGTGRVYTLTYTGTDLAGNTATCSTNVSVPHDRGQ
jgi:Bacterial Ig-like domain (group 2)